MLPHWLISSLWTMLNACVSVNDICLCPWECYVSCSTLLFGLLKISGKYTVLTLYSELDYSALDSTNSVLAKPWVLYKC